VRHRAEYARQSADCRQVALGQSCSSTGVCGRNGTVACSSCHDPARALLTEGASRLASKGRIGKQRAHYSEYLYNTRSSGTAVRRRWRTSGVSDRQIPSEMGQPNWRLPLPGSPVFASIERPSSGCFTDRPTLQPPAGYRIYERTEVSFDSPFDHFIAGEKNAIELQPSAVGRFSWPGRCTTCHSVHEASRMSRFSLIPFHDIGVVAVRADTVTWRARQSRSSHRETWALSIGPPFNQTVAVGAFS